MEIGFKGGNEGVENEPARHYFFLKSGLLGGSITLPFNLTERYCSSLNPFFSISISERIRIGSVRLLTGGVCLLIPGHTHP